MYTKQTTSQVNQEKAQYNTHFFKAKRKQWQSSPVLFVQQLSAGRRRILNSLIWMHRNWKKVAPSQEYIAKRVGLSRPYVNQIIQEFEALTMLTKITEHMQTCIYTLTTFFDAVPIQRLLKSMLPAIVCFNLSLLSVQRKERLATQENVQLVKKKKLTPYNTHSYLYIYIANAIANTNSRSSSNFKKNWREKMSSLENTPRVQFTDYGLIKLSAFPKEALAHALTEWKKQKAVNDPFKWFCKVANDYCSLHNIKPDWRSMYKRLEEGDYSDDMPTHIALKEPLYSAQEEENMPANRQSTRSCYTENPSHTRKFQEVLYRSQGRIKATNQGLEKGSAAFEAFVKNYIDDRFKESA